MPLTPTTETTTEEGEQPSRQSLTARLRAGRRSLRGRILVPFVAILTMTTVASIFIQDRVLENELDDRVDADLRQEVDELQRLVGGRDPNGGCVAGRDPQGGCVVGRDPETGRPFGRDIQAVFDTFLRRNIPSEYETMITFVDGAPYKVPAVRAEYANEADDELLPLATITEPQRGTAETSRGRIRYLAVPVRTADGGRGGVFAVAQFVDLQRDEVDDFLRRLAATELLLLIVACALAYILAGRLLAPVRSVTETARHISETDLSRRIDVVGDDEAADLARTFNQMLDRLQTAFLTQRQFVDDAGHELRTPITIIRGNLELLSDDPVERAEAVAIMTDELDRMTRMVEDLLLLARAERPDFLTLDVVDVGSMTEDLVAKASSIADRTWREDGVGRGSIVADPQRVTQAVMQLAQNAADHTDAGMPIAIGSSLVNGEARFWVHDSGPGVPARDVDSIFERFSRGSRTRRGEGSGLGLSIVRAIADAHGGHVELVARDGQGARFTLVLPSEGPANNEGARQ